MPTRTSQVEKNGIVTMTDKNGVDSDFEVMDVINLDGKSYLVLGELQKIQNMSNSREVVILQTAVVGNRVEFSSPQEEEAENVFDIFLSKFEDPE